MNQFAYITTGDINTAFDTMIYIVGHPFVVMWGGMILHFIQRERDDAVREGRKAEWSHILTGQGVRVGYGVVSGIFAYVMTMPSSESLGVVSDDVMFMMRVAAFAIGFGCESIAASLAEKGNNAKLPSQPPK